MTTTLDSRLLAIVRSFRLCPDILPEPPPLGCRLSHSVPHLGIAKADSLPGAPHRAHPRRLLGANEPRPRGRFENGLPEDIEEEWSGLQEQRAGRRHHRTRIPQ